MKLALKQPYRQFFGTLANQVRLEIIEQLSTGKSNVTDIVTNLNYDQSTISHSLKRLEECGFVKVQPRGKEKFQLDSFMNKNGLCGTRVFIDSINQKIFYYEFLFMILD